MSVPVVSPADPGQPQLPMPLRPPATGRSPLRSSPQSSPSGAACTEPRRRRRPADATQPELPMTPPVDAGQPELPVVSRAAEVPAAVQPELSAAPRSAAELPVVPRPTAARPEPPMTPRSADAASRQLEPPAAVQPELPAAPRPAAVDLPLVPPVVVSSAAEGHPEVPVQRSTDASPAAESDSEQSQLPMALRPPAPPAAAGLLTQARRGLAEAERETDPVEQFVGAYLAALRAAAAVLAARGRPHRGRARPASTWVLLDSVAPELREWSAFFASNSAARAAAQAGITGKVSAESAAQLVRAATPFLELVRRLVHGLPITGEAHVA
ncbi:SAV_6107 family HEPN domain-containing protein [Amycolatopsis stemonae]